MKVAIIIFSVQDRANNSYAGVIDSTELRWNVLNSEASRCINRAREVNQFPAVAELLEMIQARLSLNAGAKQSMTWIFGQLLRRSNRSTLSYFERTLSAVIQSTLTLVIMSPDAGGYFSG